MSTIGVTPGSGAEVFVYLDGSGDAHPPGVVEYLVGSTPTAVSSSTPLPVSVGSTVAVSAASLPLPTGAATAAKQPALGTAGSSSTDVISIQGIASGVSVPVSIGSTVTIVGTVAVSGSVAVTGTFWQATQPVSGTFWQTTQPVSAASLPLPTGAATAAKQPALGTAGSSSTDVISIQGIASGVSVPVAFVPATTGGLSVNALYSANTTNATSVKASAGQLYGYSLFNTTSTAFYVKLYDKASAPTVGTDTPVRRILVPAFGGIERAFSSGMQFSTGIAFAVTANAVDSDTTAVAAGAALVNIDFK